MKSVFAKRMKPLRDEVVLCTIKNAVGTLYNPSASFADSSLYTREPEESSPSVNKKDRFQTKSVFKSYLAGVAGFEPTNNGVKVRCLTPWRHPNIKAVK